MGNRKILRDIDKSPNFIDLFAGAGGLGEGFIAAGFTPVAHVEMDHYASLTLRTRSCFHFLKQKKRMEPYYQYLRGEKSREELYALIPDVIHDSVICEKLDESTMDLIFDRINHLMQQKRMTRLDLLVGGPPCQAYSGVGRSRKCMKNDPRNRLYEYYFKILKKYDPEMFVFENVPGLETAGEGKYISDIKAKFESLQYELDKKLLDASDYGVLQKRKRIFLIGWKRNTKHFYPVIEKERWNNIIADILIDLPKIEPGDNANVYSGEISDYLRKTEIRNEHDILTWHVARRHIERDREIYRNVIKAWNYDRKRLKYTDLPGVLLTHKNKSGFLDRFKIVASDLPVSHTLMAHIAKDGHYYIHPDLEQARSISVREAARIQSFPDNYFFEGPRTSAFVQIGNAVPPLMSKAIAASLYKQFTEVGNDVRKSDSE